MKRSMLMPLVLCFALLLGACGRREGKLSQTGQTLAGTATVVSTVVPTEGSEDLSSTPTLTDTVALTATVVPTDTLLTGHKVGICHRTGSTTNPYNYIEISRSALPAHEGHGDLVEDVESEADCPEMLQVTATVTATATLTPTASPTASSTATPALTPTVSPTAATEEGGKGHKVGICHRTGSEKKPYHYINVSRSAIPAHEGHGDIIGVSSEADCPQTATDSKDKGGKPDKAKPKPPKPPKPAKPAKPAKPPKKGGGKDK